MGRDKGGEKRRTGARKMVAAFVSVGAKGTSVRKVSYGTSVKARTTSCAASTSNRVLAMAAKPVTTSEQISKQLPTVEQQRSAAREMISYFKEKNAEAEISNGRWVMFGLMVGMLTEFSTGVKFIENV